MKPAAPPSLRPITKFMRRVMHVARRGVHILRHGDIRQLGLFVTGEVVRNTHLRFRIRYSSDQQRVSCNICGWGGPRFLTHLGAGYVVWDAMCPRCAAFLRHRGSDWLLANELTYSVTPAGNSCGDITSPSDESLLTS